MCDDKTREKALEWQISCIYMSDDGSEGGKHLSYTLAVYTLFSSSSSPPHSVQASIFNSFAKGCPEVMLRAKVGVIVERRKRVIERDRQGKGSCVLTTELNKRKGRKPVDLCTYEHHSPFFPLQLCYTG